MSTGEQEMPRRKLVVVVADCNWSIGRVHRDIAEQLQDEYEFKMHNDSNALFPQTIGIVRESLYKADIVLSTPNILRALTTLYEGHEQDLFSRTILLFHYSHTQYESIERHPYFNRITFATISEVVPPPRSFSANVTWLPSGIPANRFLHRAHTGRIKRLGWCGALAWNSKRPDWSYRIAEKVNLPIVLAISIPFEEMQAWYHSMDLLIVTSGPDALFETGPLPAFESILCGVPVIGTRVGNFRLVPGPKFDSVDEAADIVRELCSDTERVQRLAAEQFQYVVDNFTTSQVAKRWRACFADLLDKLANVDCVPSAHVE